MQDLETAYRWAAVALTGAASSFIGLLAALWECSFLPKAVRKSRHIPRRLGFLICLFVVNLLPGGFVFAFPAKSKILTYAAVGIGMLFSVVTLLLLLFIPPARLPFRTKADFFKSHGAAFTSNFAPLKKVERLTSIGLWSIVFASKFIESLAFVIMPIGKPVDILTRALAVSDDCKDTFYLCLGIKYLIVLNLISLVLALYFLDTYMWWIGEFAELRKTNFTSLVHSPGCCEGVAFRIIGSDPVAKCICEAAGKFQRMVSKILGTSAVEAENHEKALCSKLWNSIILSMSFDHLLSLKQLKRLAFWKKRLPAQSGSGNVLIKQPRFFLEQEDVTTKNQYVLSGSEAERRMYFFAKSLWENFLFDTKLGAGDFGDLKEFDEKGVQHNEKDIPLAHVGFRDHSEAGILRTRIWASLRSQTLFRTVAGFMNYPQSISLLHQIEKKTQHRPQTSSFINDPDFIEPDLDMDEELNCVNRKFTFVLAMQNFIKLDEKQSADADLLLEFYPNLRIGYLDKEEGEGNLPDKYFAVLIDGHCPKLPSNRRRPLYRIELPGTPFLGDGKADNQNLNLIWTRGEYIQLVDANQDHYFEETVKIRSLLAEFEDSDDGPPVAIVGAREHIFSEGVGVLGDVAAGKEYSFGTIVQRVSAKLRKDYA
ncbi:1,3-beta-D-glucan synthase [Phlyctochytrium planicorne]|nr:1,3-beta-D-glucan synthase [Phlyctochytrium planicorne]